MLPSQASAPMNRTWTIKYPAGLPQEVFLTLRVRVAKEKLTHAALPTEPPDPHARDFSGQTPTSIGSGGGPSSKSRRKRLPRRRGAKRSDEASMSVAVHQRCSWTISSSSTVK